VSFQNKDNGGIETYRSLKKRVPEEKLCNKKKKKKGQNGKKGKTEALGASWVGTYVG